MIKKINPGILIYLDNKNRSVYHAEFLKLRKVFELIRRV